MFLSEENVAAVQQKLSLLIMFEKLLQLLSNRSSS